MKLKYKKEVLEQIRKKEAAEQIDSYIEKEIDKPAHKQLYNLIRWFFNKHQTK